jgi:DNA polymerase-3 subunit delta'
VLILVVPDAGATLPTIRSRCQVVELRPVPRDELAEALIARGGLAPAQARALAALARGRAGWAIAAGERPEFLAERDAAVGAMLDLLEGPAVELYPAVDRLVDRFKRGRRDEVRADLDAWLGLWRDLLLLRAGCEELVSNVAQVERLRPLAARFGLERFRVAVEATRDASRWLDENVTPRLALETMVSRWPMTRTE